MEEEQRRITSRDRRKASSRAWSLESKLESIFEASFSKHDIIVVYTPGEFAN
jgi:uncharacterized protein (DUF1697 family)